MEAVVNSWPLGINSSIDENNVENKSRRRGSKETIQHPKDKGLLGE